MYSGQEFAGRAQCGLGQCGLGFLRAEWCGLRTGLKMRAECGLAGYALLRTFFRLFFGET